MNTSILHLWSKILTLYKCCPYYLGVSMWLKSEHDCYLGTGLHLHRRLIRHSRRTSHRRYATIVIGILRLQSCHALCDHTTKSGRPHSAYCFGIGHIRLRFWQTIIPDTNEHVGQKQVRSSSEDVSKHHLLLTKQGMDPSAIAISDVRILLIWIPSKQAKG